MITLLFAATPFAIYYRLRKKIREHDAWLDEMYELAADYECGRFTSNFVVRLKKLQADYERLTGEPWEGDLTYVLS